MYEYNRVFWPDPSSLMAMAMVALSASTSASASAMALSALVALSSAVTLSAMIVLVVVALSATVVLVVVAVLAMVVLVVVVVAADVNVNAALLTLRAVARPNSHRRLKHTAHTPTFALKMVTTRLGSNASNESSEEHGGSKKLHGSFQVGDFWNGKQQYDNGVNQLKLNRG